MGFEKALDFRLLMDLQVFGCPEHEMTISEKKSVCVCVCVCDKNFVASVARELRNRIS